jgi:hypothetical protein
MALRGLSLDLVIMAGLSFMRLLHYTVLDAIKMVSNSSKVIYSHDHDSGHWRKVAAPVSVGNQHGDER